MLDFDALRSLPLFSNTLSAWLVAAMVAVGMFAALVGARSLVRRYLRKVKATPQTELLEIPAEVLSRTTLAFFVIVAVGLAMRSLTIGPVSQRVIGSAMTIALFWQAGLWAMAVVEAWLDGRRRRGMAEDRAALGSLNIISFIVNVVVWALVLLLTLDNLGINITALVAGLGIGGIAVALALQNVLGDLFASLSITLDKPFVVGDFLIVDEYLGSVEHIGIKSTRLRSLGGEQIIVANSDLLKSRVRNYGRMTERRVVFPTGVTYETPIEEVERIPQLIREIIESQPGTRFDRSHFQRHGESSLDFETVYYVLSPDFNRYMDIQQQINLRLHRSFAQMGVEFAYPTRRIIGLP